MKLAISGRIFEQTMRENSLPTFEFIDFAKMIGCDGVGLRHSQGVRMSLSDAELNELSERLRLAGLGVCSVSTLPEVRLTDADALEGFKRYVDIAAALGCDTLRTQGQLECLRQAADYAAEHSVRIMKPLHIRSDTETAAEVMALIKQIARTNVGVNFDAFHATMTQETPISEMIHRLGDRIFQVTVQGLYELSTSDPDDASVITYRDRRYKVCLPFDPRCIIDFAEVAGVLREIGYAGSVVLFSPVIREEGEPKDVAREQYEAMKQLFS
jgi:sugar phosphate isomerase/epimerase